MNDKKPSPASRYWYMPACIVLLAGIAAIFWFREKPLSEIGAAVSPFKSEFKTLESAHMNQPVVAVRYKMDTTYKVGESTVRSVTTSTVRPVGDGWVVRLDQVRDELDQALFAEERFVSYRGIIGVQREWRNLPPFAMELLAEFGWQREVATKILNSPSGEFPTVPASIIRSVQTRKANFDYETGRHSEAESIFEQTRTCERGENSAASTIHSSLTETGYEVICTTSIPSAHVNNTSRSLYVPSLGLYLPRNSSIVEKGIERNWQSSLRSLERL
jgi:hypothetical protein